MSFAKRRAWWLVIIFGLLSQGAHSVVSVTEDVTHYHFFAKTMKDFYKEIGKYSGSSKWTGFTTGSVRYQWEPVESRSQCRPTDIRIFVKIKYKMPNLFPTYKEAAVKSRFEEYYARLKIHEDGHGRVWRLAGQDLNRELPKITGKSCDIVKSKMREKYGEIISYHRKMNAQYDVLTDHGRKQDRLPSVFFQPYQGKR